jgi:DNA replication and repair protein RecF
MIRKIKLTNFRRFKELELNIEKELVILHGDNARGKSTILEAIYLITNGISPWASTDEFVSNEQKEDEKYTRIEITIDDETYSFFKNKGRRIFKINNHNTTPRKFFERTASTIFNPEQIEILMISSTKRREFLDEAIIITQYEFSETLKLFRKVLKQRNAYLKKLSKDFYEKGIIARNDPQLNFWTEEFIQLANDIQRKRMEICKALCLEHLKVEYVKSNKDIELGDALEQSKKRDIATGYTNIGPHRDDWVLINGTDIKKFGSRGEKRLAIGQLVYQKQELIADKLKFYPILLLDDISSELDSENIKKVFDKDILKRQQTFITIINEKDLPSSILKNAQLINLNALK